MRINETVTPIKDKHYKPVYERDIVTIPNHYGRRYMVVFRFGVVVLVDEDTKSVIDADYLGPSEYSYLGIPSTIMTKIEVVGHKE